MTSDTKIFCIGLNKTGTSSLHEAFKILGFKSVHFLDDKGNNIKDIIERNYHNNEHVLKGISHYEAFSDWDRDETSHKVFKLFDQQYPNSKFILNTRDLDSWLNSREKHVRRNQKSFSANFGMKKSWLKIDREAWSVHFKRHHQSIYEYFEGRESDILVFDVTQGDSWDKLCSFLDVETPKVAFPKANINAKDLTFFQKLKKKLILLLKNMS
ncbi:sulfotransferase family protein [Psychroflexus aestuariivivens]|uniref:sulfotransferase family protein n=1 Tax=Psychroflexus aestuariivivens TaxID=1795040 RepID=UPI000FDB0DE3|nr:sulfotransferase family protein [Psychroflexus aestuariivivens]